MAENFHFGHSTETEQPLKLFIWDFGGFLPKSSFLVFLITKIVREKWKEKEGENDKEQSNVEITSVYNEGE